jgi:nitrogen fixation NifU-like protein
LIGMEELYRENILDHYKHPHNWSPPEAELEGADLEFQDLNPLCGDELRVQLALDGEGRIEAVRLCDLAGGGVDGLGRGQGDAG